MQLVSRTNLTEVIEELKNIDALVFDTETTGLRAYHDAKMFSLALADLTGRSWYFNFKAYKDLESDFVLEPELLTPLFSEKKKWIAHNAKFDMHFTGKAGLLPQGEIHDTEIMARIFENHHQYKGGYSLAVCAARWLSVSKDDRVKTWMDENGAYDVYPNAEGRDTKHYHFDLVPFEMISQYACQDAVVTGELFKFLTERLYETSVLKTESQLTRALYDMEKLGLNLDRRYCRNAYDYETQRLNEIKKKCTEICGPDFMDSSKFLAPILEVRGLTLPQTEKGNPQITDDILKQNDDALAALILDLRDANKRAITYWSNYLFLADEEGVIHPNLRQCGTITGRMACDNPNLQNIPAEDDGPYPVRRAFIPREGFTFCSIDFMSMEFRLALEYARELELIEKIKAGFDPHDSTAELTGLTRKAAKTLNFMVLYGGGYAKIAAAIGCSIEEAKRFKYRYFDALPGVRTFIRESSRRMEMRGFTFNWAGRRYQLDDPRFSYKAANAIIQGGCADICKAAMVHLSQYLGRFKSRMVLQVHDEVLFEIANDELIIIPDLVHIMETAYLPKHMPLECSVSVGQNFHDMKEIGGLSEVKSYFGKGISSEGNKGA